MKYKSDIHMKFKAPWPLLSDSVINFFTLLYQFFIKIIIRKMMSPDNI